MTPQTATGKRASLVDALTDQLVTPAPTDAEQHWQAQSLAKGAAGVALLHIERPCRLRDVGNRARLGESGDQM
ncbi:MAG: hypothetical protein ACRDUV_05460 [Pseudonocardiaceae bacterium]